jgi:uncharacterized protein (DUF111 family)
MTEKPAKEKRTPMSARQFQATLKKLGLTVASQQTSRLLGVGVRQCMRLAHGDNPVPLPVELLLKMYLKHGIGDDG